MCKPQQIRLRVCLVAEYVGILNILYSPNVTLLETALKTIQAFYRLHTKLREVCVGSACERCIGKAFFQAL